MTLDIQRCKDKTMHTRRMCEIVNVTKRAMATGKDKIEIINPDPSDNMNNGK